MPPVRRRLPARAGGTQTVRPRVAQQMMQRRERRYLATIAEPFAGPERLYRVMDDFDLFAREHAEGLLRTAYLVVWDAWEAEDLVQECLLKIARRWRKVRNMEMPLAYARRILINLALDDSPRRFRRRAELQQPTTVGRAVVDPIGAHEERVALLDALAMLPIRQRAVLVLRYFNDLTEQQAAELLGCSPGTVKSRNARGLARLRELSGQPEITPEPCNAES